VLFWPERAGPEASKYFLHRAEKCFGPRAEELFGIFFSKRARNQNTNFGSAATFATVKTQHLRCGDMYIYIYIYIYISPDNCVTGERPKASVAVVDPEYSPGRPPLPVSISTAGSSTLVSSGQTWAAAIKCRRPTQCGPAGGGDVKITTFPPAVGLMPGLPLVSAPSRPTTEQSGSAWPGAIGPPSPPRDAWPQQSAPPPPELWGILSKAYGAWPNLLLLRPSAFGVAGLLSSLWARNALSALPSLGPCLFCSLSN